MNIEEFGGAIGDWLENSQDQLIKGNWRAVSKTYPFLTLGKEDAPFTPFRKRIKFCRIGVISGAGLYLREKQRPFNMTAVDGDFSTREMPKHIFADDIECSHEHTNSKYARQDINAMFPLELLREMERNETLGELSERQFSIYDFIPRADRIAEDLGKPLMGELAKEEVDIALFVPVSELGHQTMTLLQRLIEAQGVSTLMVANSAKMLEFAAPPRALLVDTPDGAPFGEPNNKNMQRQIIDECLAMLSSTNGPGEVHKSKFSWSDPYL